MGLGLVAGFPGIYSTIPLLLPLGVEHTSNKSVYVFASCSGMSICAGSQSISARSSEMQNSNNKGSIEANVEPVTCRERARLQICESTKTHTHTRTHTHPRTHAPTREHTHTHTYTHTHVYTRMCTRVHMYTYTHVHVRTQEKSTNKRAVGSNFNHQTPKSKTH